MPEIIIKTNGTSEGTSLSVDGADITGTCKCINISLFAMAPYTSSYDKTRMPGSVSCSYECCNGEGVIERKSVYSTEGSHDEGIGSSGEAMEESDSVGKPSRAIRYLGQAVDVEISNLVDKIMTHCTEKKLGHPTKEVLLTRSMASLKDKAEDLGIKLEG